MPKALISRALDTVGDGSGVVDAVGNYLATPQDFLIKPDVGRYIIARLIVTVGDTPGMHAQEYGNLDSALLNGIAVGVYDDEGLVYNLTDPNFPVTTNANWGSTCYDVDIKSWGQTPTDELLLVRWTFARTGKDIDLRSWLGEKLVVTLNDNFTGLQAHHFMAQGWASPEI